MCTQMTSRVSAIKKSAHDVGLRVANDVPLGTVVTLWFDGNEPRLARPLHAGSPPPSSSFARSSEEIGIWSVVTETRQNNEGVTWN